VAVHARPIRIYADTSVYGGVFDDEFRRFSRVLFDHVRSGRLQLVVSPLVLAELADAPPRVREFFAEIAPLAETIPNLQEASDLQRAHLRAGVVVSGSSDDALHVALSTVSGCKAIVSWNFKHIVNFGRIPLYNGVNEANGYGRIGIHSPAEVVE
jgi:predicted nucleic acid-binding protein